MTVRDPEKLRKLLTQVRLKRRAGVLATRWAAQGVAVSNVAHSRYWKLVDRLRGGHSWPLQHVDDLSSWVRSFVGASDLVIIMGWNVEEEPALLFSSDALLRTMPNIAAVYPDGFVLINDEAGTALLIDIDEDAGVQGNRITLPA